MRKHIAQRLAGAAIGGYRGDLDMGMARGEPQGFGAGIAARSQNRDAYHLFITFRGRHITLRIDQTKKRRPQAGALKNTRSARGSALGELEALARLWLAVFFALDHA